MRSYIVTTITSADGFVAGPGGDVMAMPMDDAFDAYNLERMEAADTVVLGATSFRLFLSFWPPVADDPGRSEVERAISRRWTEMEKVVISDQLTPDECGPWRDGTRVVGRADAVEEVRRLRRVDGADLLSFGSATAWNALLTAALVDELHLMVAPMMLGGGTPLVGPSAATHLRLLDVRRFGDSDNIVLRYAVR